MSLSTCEKCGGHIPLGPDASNRCEKCGEHVMGSPRQPEPAAAAPHFCHPTDSTQCPVCNPKPSAAAEVTDAMVEAAVTEYVRYFEKYVNDHPNTSLPIARKKTMRAAIEAALGERK